ncbi:MAG TPA: FAD-binding domain-containing protein, partial [Flavisolibacter sp.]
HVALPDESIIKRYDETRNIPSIPGTTRMGIHLRFGTISIRTLVAKALQLNQVYLSELIWREFFMQILWHHPRVINEACKKEYDNIKWRNNEEEFERWCQGQTGYPIVDAGMRELNETGFMHNRVRMIVGSFLVKDLLIDWRWGEAYFAQKLLDYELSSNNGNWQWVAGCGCDAAPYFRVFNPGLQAKKFDPHGKYIERWVPELETMSYAKPIVDHEFAKQRCLKAYKAALSERTLLAAAK